MTEKSRFFNSEVGDVREYGADEFAEYFNKFLSDGVYTENNTLGLKVLAGTGLDVNVATGFAYLKGYLYENDGVLNKSVDASDSVLNRIDRVVIRLDEVARQIQIYIKKGEFASNAIPPSLENTGTIRELSLAQVKVNKSATTVQIVDERLTDFCGQVSLLIQVPLNDLMTEWDQFKTTNQLTFDDFMAQLIDTLDENTAGNLLNLINGLELSKMDKTKITISQYDADVNEMVEGGIHIKYK